MIAVPHFDDDLRAILAASPDGAFVGENRRIVLWNRAASEIMGYTATEALGRACFDLFTDLDDGGGPLRDPTCVREQAEPGPPVRAFDVRATTKAGRPLWLHLTAFPLHARNGAALVVHLFRDVTPTRELVTLVRERLTGSRKEGPFTAYGHAPLTRRELQVLRLMAQGLHTAMIAQRLHISRATVRNHVQNILWKLDAHTRLQAVAYAARHYLL
jgi:PAS domain S-box-containing protein